MDERIPPRGGSLGEAARRDITEAYPAAGQGLTAAVGFINGRTWQVVTAESLDVRNLPSHYRSASNGGDRASPEWREAMAVNLYGARCCVAGAPCGRT